jgi:phosphatidylinositol-bisphosphatase
VVLGDKATIHMTLLVDAVSAPVLNAGEDLLEDILILHLDNGKDFFVSVSATYIPTCFANSLERLTRLSGPIRSMDITEMRLLDHEHQLRIPRELWRIVDYIYQHGQSVPQLFLRSGNPFIMTYIRDCLDTGMEFQFETLSERGWPQDGPNDVKLDRDQTVYAMAETLLRFLEALPEPVISFDHYQKCLDAAMNGKEACIMVSRWVNRQMDLLCFV